MPTRKEPAAQLEIAPPGSLLNKSGRNLAQTAASRLSEAAEQARQMEKALAPSPDLRLGLGMVAALEQARQMENTLAPAPDIRLELGMAAQWEQARLQYEQAVLTALREVSDALAALGKLSDAETGQNRSVRPWPRPSSTRWPMSCDAPSPTATYRATQAAQHEQGHRPGDNGSTSCVSFFERHVESKSRSPRRSSPSKLPTLRSTTTCPAQTCWSRPTPPCRTWRGRRWKH